MNIWIYGAGDLGREYLNTINEINKIDRRFNVLGFVDDRASLKGQSLCNYEIIDFESISTEQLSSSFFVVAIGNSVIKNKILSKLKVKGAQLSAPIIHPQAYVSDEVTIGQGVYIGPNTTVSIACEIGENAIINQNCSIGHDCQLANDVVISPGCIVSGRVEIGEAAFLSSGVVVLPGIQIGEFSVVGANVTVAQNVEARHKILSVTRNMSLPIEGV